MPIPPIEWSDFSWEAFATLTTGALAVAGAIVVGLRQASIQQRQADISSRQVHLDELSLRNDLFDRRFVVYEATRRYLGDITRHADRPSDTQIEYNFVVAMDQSKFIFQEHVYTGLRELYEKTLSFFALKSVMTATFDREGHYGNGNPEKEYECMQWMANRQVTLSDLFGIDMKLAPLRMDVEE